MEKKLAVIVDNNEEITTGNDGTEMCSSGADVAVEMCSPESHDTCGDCGSTTPSKADCRIPKQSNIRRAIGEHEKCNRKQQQDSGCGFRRQKRRLAIPFVFDKQ